MFATDDSDENAYDVAEGREHRSRGFSDFILGTGSGNSPRSGSRKQLNLLSRPSPEMGLRKVLLQEKSQENLVKFSNESAKKNDSYSHESEKNKDSNSNESQKRNDPFSNGNQNRKDSFTNENQKRKDSFSNDNQKQKDFFSNENQNRKDSYYHDNQKRKDSFSSENRKRKDSFSNENTKRKDLLPFGLLDNFQQRMKRREYKSSESLSRIENVANQSSGRDGSSSRKFDSRRDSEVRYANGFMSQVARTPRAQDSKWTKLEKDSRQMSGSRQDFGRMTRAKSVSEFLAPLIAAPSPKRSRKVSTNQNQQIFEMDHNRQRNVKFTRHASVELLDDHESHEPHLPPSRKETRL